MRQHHITHLALRRLGKLGAFALIGRRYLHSAISRYEYLAWASWIDKNLKDAAPELMGACKKIVNNWGNLHPKDRHQLRQAIAKAEGR